MTEARRFNASNDDNQPGNEEPIEWINYRLKMKEDSAFTFDFQRISYKEDAGSHDGEVFYLFNDEDNQGASIWITPHPEALFEVNVTDGQRLGNALLRALNESDLSVYDIVDRTNMSNGGKLLVKKADLKNGHWAWRWEVRLNKAN